MKNRIHAVAILVAVLVVLGATSQAHSVSTNNQRFAVSVLSNAALADGPGPMCPPTTGCGNGNFVAERLTLFRAQFLLVDSRSPMCFASIRCIYKAGELGTEGQIPAAVLLTDGGGPMCIPHTACGYRHGLLAAGLHVPGGVLLADGGGPMCIPGTACTSRLFSLETELRS
jgi:hypothetical protein